jgi:hypothetical protein
VCISIWSQKDQNSLTIKTPGRCHVTSTGTGAGGGQTQRLPETQQPRTWTPGACARMGGTPAMLPALLLLTPIGCCYYRSCVKIPIQKHRSCECQNPCLEKENWHSQNPDVFKWKIYSNTWSTIVKNTLSNIVKNMVNDHQKHKQTSSTNMVNYCQKTWSNIMGKPICLFNEKLTCVVLLLLSIVTASAQFQNSITCNYCGEWAVLLPCCRLCCCWRPSAAGVARAGGLP